MTRHGRPDPGLRLAIAVCLVLVAIVTWAICGTAEAAPTRATVKIAPHLPCIDIAWNRQRPALGASTRARHAWLHSCTRSPHFGPMRAHLWVPRGSPSSCRPRPAGSPRSIRPTWRDSIPGTRSRPSWLPRCMTAGCSTASPSTARGVAAPVGLTFRAYNGGEKALNRERALAYTKGADANDWRAVEPYRARAEWAHREHRLSETNPADTGASVSRGRLDGVATCP